MLSWESSDYGLVVIEYKKRPLLNNGRFLIYDKVKSLVYSAATATLPVAVAVPAVAVTLFWSWLAIQILGYL